MTNVHQLQCNDQVVLDVPENPRLHNALGRVLMTTEWGAFVSTPAAASGQFRAAWHEMKPVVSGNDRGKVHANGKVYGRETMAAVARGYHFDPCDKCGAFALKRSGVCFTCDVCGSTSGCS